VGKFSMNSPIHADVVVTPFVRIITCPRTITALGIITRNISRILSTAETAGRNYTGYLSDVTDVDGFYVMIVAYRRIISVQTSIPIQYRRGHHLEVVNILYNLASIPNHFAIAGKQSGKISI